MNIISNNCAGAAIYKYVLFTEYKNPFIWCYSDIEAIAANYNTINWTSISIYNEQPNLFGRWHIVIDKIIDLNFIHAYLDVSCHTPTIQAWNVRYDKIWEYLVDKYVTRTKRMLIAQESPIYVVNIQTYKDIPLADNIKHFTDRYLIISPDHIYPNAHITYKASTKINPDNPIVVVKSLRDDINNFLQLMEK